MSPDVEEKESGLVRSKRVPPAVKMPGNWAALVPLVNVPLDPKSASEPLLFAFRPHCSAAFGSDLSSHRSTAIGRPSAHWLLTALSAAAVACFVSVEMLGIDSGPVRLRMLVNWRGLPVQDGSVPATFACATTEPPACAPRPKPQQATVMKAARTTTVNDNRRTANIMTPRHLSALAPIIFPKDEAASDQTTTEGYFCTSARPLLRGHHPFATPVRRRPLRARMGWMTVGLPAVGHDRPAVLHRCMVERTVHVD